MKKLAAFLAALWMPLAAQADQVVVVELFTSQGCYSCPPADKILGELKERDDVIALALHVDYWDYLGWKDEFASPAFTQRQRSYAQAMGERSVYTPQMVIGGVEHVVGSRSMKVANAIRKHAQRDAAVNVTIRRSGGTVFIEASPATGDVPGAVVQLVTYTREATVDIRRGENAGKTLTYHNIVRTFSRLGNWNGSSPYRANADITEGVPVVALVQDRNSGAILGAAQLR